MPAMIYDSKTKFKTPEVFGLNHLEGAESEKIVPAGHNLFSNAATISEIKRILDKNIRRRRSKATHGKGL